MLIGTGRVRMLFFFRNAHRKEREYDPNNDDVDDNVAGFGPDEQLPRCFNVTVEIIVRSNILFAT